MSKDGKNDKLKSPLETPLLSTIKHENPGSFPREKLEDKLREELEKSIDQDMLNIITSVRGFIKESLKPYVNKYLKEEWKKLNKSFKKKTLSPEKFDADSKKIKELEQKLQEDPERLLVSPHWDILSESTQYRLNAIIEIYTKLEDKHHKDLQTYKDITKYPGLKKIISKPKPLGNEKSTLTAPANSNSSKKKRSTPNRGSWTLL